MAQDPTGTPDDGVPRFENEEQLKAWLEDKPAAWSRVIAARVSLRVFPLVFTAYDVPDKTLSLDQKKRLLLVCWRAVFISVAACKYPASDMRPAVSATASETSNFAKSIAEKAFNLYFELVVKTVISASALAVITQTVADTDAASAVARCVSTADVSTENFPMEKDADYPIWNSVRADARFLSERRDEKLIDQPLWLEDVRADDDELANLPPWARDPFDQFLMQIWVRESEWRQIVNWYRGILPNASHMPPQSAFGEAAEIEIATQPPEFWGDGDEDYDPDAVMEAVAKIVEEHRQADHSETGEWAGLNSEPIGFMSADFGLYKQLGDLPEDEANEVAKQLIQEPAPHRFSSADGPIEPLPPINQTNLEAFAETTLAEAIEKSNELKQRFDRANAPRRVKQTINRLLDALPADLALLNPARLRAKSRPLEADSIAYAAAGADAELFPDAISMMLDLNATLSDLQSCYPVVEEVNRAASRIEIAGRENETFDALATLATDAIAFAQDHPELLSNTAAEAVSDFLEDAENAPTDEVKADILASALLTAKNFASAVYRKVLSLAGRHVIKVAVGYYTAAIEGSTEGLRDLARQVPLLGLAYLVGGPLGLIAAMFAQNKALNAAKNIVDSLTKPLPNEGSEKPSDETDIRDA